MIDWNRKVTTRVGHEVHIVSTDGPAPYYPVVGYIITPDGEMLITDWTKEGQYMRNGWVANNDLVNADE